LQDETYFEILYHSAVHKTVQVHYRMLIDFLCGNSIIWRKSNVRGRSVLIYGVETWSLYEDDRRRINATEMKALRRLARISKLD